MGGVVSGTAIMLPKNVGSLHTITLTINNQCNLRCPHCYLKYNGNEGIITDDIVDSVLSDGSSFQHLAIVGKEPLVDDLSASICRGIITKANKKGLTVSLITNGINLPSIGEDVLPLVSFIDISLDGGRLFYPQYRGVPIDSIEANISWLKKHSFARINALEVLNNRTLFYIEDMMEFALSSGFSQIMFSPYIPTESDGENDVTFITLKQSLSALKKSSLFMASSNSFLMIDIYHCWFEGISLNDARVIARSEGMSHKVYFVPAEPTELGVMRVTYDGLVLPSFDALHTSWYWRRGRRLEALPNLNRHYARFFQEGLIKSERRAA